MMLVVLVSAGWSSLQSPCGVGVEAFGAGVAADSGAAMAGYCTRYLFLSIRMCRINFVIMKFEKDHLAQWIPMAIVHSVQLWSNIAVCDFYGQGYTVTLRSNSQAKISRNPPEIATF